MKLFQYDIVARSRDFFESRFLSVLDTQAGRLSRFVSFCVILSVLIIIFETVPSIGKAFSYEFFVADLVISSIFAIEYIMRFMRAKHKGLFAFSPMNIIDFLSFFPFFLGLIFHIFGIFDIFKVLRLFRILRLFELSSHSPIVIGFLRTIHQYRREYKAIFSLFVTILVVISTFVYYAESSINPDFANIPLAMWWGLVTMTTVGYGDMVPLTAFGKILGTILILLGPVLVAVMGSITILVFMDVAESQKISAEKICNICKTKNPDEANFCYHCGNSHFIDGVLRKTEKKSLLRKLFHL